MTLSDQGHQPAKAPGGAGGQWTIIPNSDPEAILPDETHGSFLFPPVSYGNAGVESYIQFWETTPVSDRVLSNVVSTYRQNRETWLGEQLDRWAVAFGNDSNNLRRWAQKSVTPEAMILEHDAARTIELARLKAERPIASIYGSQARGIAVAAQMYNNCTSFTPEEQKRVDEHQLVIERGVGPETVASLYKKYNLAEIVGVAFVDQDVAVQHELAELRKHIGARDSL